MVAQIAEAPTAREQRSGSDVVRLGKWTSIERRMEKVASLGQRKYQIVSDGARCGAVIVLSTSSDIQ